MARGTTESFVVETDPVGATVAASAGWTCTTPCEVEVQRRGDFEVSIAKEGYETANVVIASHVDRVGVAAMAGPVVVGGLLDAVARAGAEIAAAVVGGLLGLDHDELSDDVKDDLKPFGIVAGVVAAGTDLGTGAVYSHRPNPLVLALVPLGEVPEQANASRRPSSGNQHDARPSARQQEQE